MKILKMAMLGGVMLGVSGLNASYLSRPWLSEIKQLRERKDTAEKIEYEVRNLAEQIQKRVRNPDPAITITTITEQLKRWVNAPILSEEQINRELHRWLLPLYNQEEPERPPMRPRYVGIREGANTTEDDQP